MSLQTLTVEQVKAIHAENVARIEVHQDAPEGFNPRESTIVMVKSALRDLNPVPYGPHILPPEMQAQRNRRAPPPGATRKQVADCKKALPLTRKEHDQHVRFMQDAVTEEDHAAYAKAKATAHKDALGVKDAHHFAQKRHQMGLWAEADRLVKEALG
jgi:hypothetical protein